MTEQFFNAALNDLVRLAEEQGFILGIDVVPHPDKPLAMGNLKMVPHVRPARPQHD